MNLQKFVKDLKEKGGASYNILTGDYNPTTGFMVSTSLFKKYPKECDHQYTISKFIRDNALILLSGHSGDNKYLGGWEFKNEIYLGVSVWVSTLSQAIETATHHSQKAIFDCSTKQDVYLNI